MRSESNPLASAHIQVRPANSTDALDILCWRNDPQTRSMSLQNNIIDEENHKKWFADALADSSRIILISILAGEKAGMVRFDNTDGDLWRVSIIVAPDFRGRGLAKTLLSVAINHFADRVPSGELFAEVKLGNVASISVFRSNGFVDFDTQRSTHDESVLTFIKKLSKKEAR